jgi:TonB family protein
MNTRACALRLAAALGCVGIADAYGSPPPGSTDPRTDSIRRSVPLAEKLPEQTKDAPSSKSGQKKRVIGGIPVESIDETLYVPPKPANLERPVYPFEMLKQRVSGEASISCLVDTDGRVVQINVLNATRPEFAEALAAAIEAAEFAYGTKEGDPIASVLGFRYRFDPRANGDDTQRREELELLELASKKKLSIGKPDRLDRPLRARKQQAPAFPVRMLKSGEQGTAVVEFYLDEYGEPKLPRVLSATDPSFGYAAAHAVSQWRFEPPTVDGHPVVMRVAVPFQFRLE